MKPESEQKIKDLAMQCLEFCEEHCNDDKYPTMKHLLLDVEKKILLPAIKKKPQEKTLVQAAAKMFQVLFEQAVNMADKEDSK